ncbi:MAG: amino acid adenylation domain-containing protein, partial [Planctomycetes bacterium]|nr:amino acid adenylation domain-containing protein [Planctomycetota bacterium]
TEDEIVQKYNSYLPVDINSLSDLLEFVDIDEGSIGSKECLSESSVSVNNFNQKLRRHFPERNSDQEVLRVLLLDLSQFFKADSDKMLYDVVDAPLGLMYILTSLYEQFGTKVCGKISKSRIDFENYSELKELLLEFKPDVIGIRTLTFYKDFFHKTVALIKHWGINSTVIAGGPYATSDYVGILQDSYVNLVVLGEGEVTFGEVIGKMIENGGKLPGEKVLRDIPGLAFLQEKERPQSVRKILFMEELSDVLSKESSSNPVPDPEIQPDNLAYVIYTSGSTGDSKGCQVTHFNVARLFAATEGLYNFDRHDVWTLFHSYAFDFSVWEIWGALLYGGQLVVVPYFTSRDPSDFYQLLINQGVTILNQTPSAFKQLLNVDNHPDELSLRLVVFGGEALDFTILQPWFANHGDERPKLVNMYGITETTVHVTHYPLINDQDYRNGIIGSPLPDLQVWVLDAHRQPVPVGVPGEMYVGGAGVTRGYLRRPGLTAEKFLEIEIFDKSHCVYRTGDRARWLPDGNLEYLGRLDNQVKLRGFRIEPGEIETLLSQHEAVQEAVVVLNSKEDNPGLAAYVTMESGQGAWDRVHMPGIGDMRSLTEDNAFPTDHRLLLIELRNWLKARLPEYMVPVGFTVLDKLPMTLNGKIDRKALPAPETLLNRKHNQAPRDTVELKLTQIWEDVLDVHPVGISDNFFELGGHSLLAVRLMSQIGQQLERNLPLATLFQNTTIGQLATILRKQTDPLPWSPLVAIQPKGEKVPIFCVHPAGGNVICYLELAEYLGIDQPFYGLQAFGVEVGQVPCPQISDMAANYLEEIQNLYPQGPYQIAGWSFGGLVAFEMARQLQAQGKSVSLLALLDTAVPSSMQGSQVPVDDAQLLVDLFAGEEITLSLEHLRQLTPDEQLNYVIEQGKEVDLFPPDVDLAQVQRFLKIYKNSVEASQRYQPHSYNGRIILFKAGDGADNESLEPDFGWGDHATGGVEIIRVPGNHQDMVKSPHVQVLTEQLKLYLQNS